MTGKYRCKWVPSEDEIYIKYHDKEWGKPLHNDKRIFEFLTLEAFQAGLSWRTVLYKRENFRQAFDDFDFEKIARYSETKISKLLEDPGIVRNKLKVLATVNNAKKFIEISKEFGTFSKYMWGWVNNEPIDRKVEHQSDYITYDDIAVKWAKDLKKRGFKFLGPTVIYSHMQAVGMVNDHEVKCFCH